MQPVTAKNFEFPGAINEAGRNIAYVHGVVNQFNVVINHCNSLTTQFTQVQTNINQFQTNVNQFQNNVNQTIQTFQNAINTNNTALNTKLDQDRGNTKKDIDRHDQEFLAHNQKINAQSGEIKDLQQRVVEASVRTGVLEAQSQEERARRGVIDNRFQQLEGQVQGINQAQAAVIETKVKLALIEQQNAFQFKLQDEEKREQAALKQQALTLAKTLQQFQQTFERDKKETKAKSDEEAFKIAQLREQIVGDAVPVAAAVHIPEKLQEDPLLIEMENEIPDPEEAKLIALMEKGGPKGDLALLEWQTQTLSCLQEKHKISRERLSRHMQALTMKMQQLVNSYEAFREMTKRKQEENAQHIAQLSAQMEPQAKNAPDRMSKLKEFRKSREINKS